MNLVRRLTQSWPLIYDPMRYWNSRENPNGGAGEEQVRIDFDINYIRTNVGVGECILELGPGIGRTFEAYAPGTEVATLDISRIYQQELADVAATRELSLTQHFMSETLERYPFSENAFDVGVCFQVFIHQPPEIFAHNFAELTRVCRRLIVSVGLHRNAAGKKAWAPHVFDHDYLAQAGKHGKLLSNVLLRDGALYFVSHEDEKRLWFERQN